MGLPPRLFRHVKQQRDKKRADRSAKADAARALLALQQERDARLAAEQDALRHAVERFMERGGPALFRRITRLSAIAHEGSELAAALRVLTPSWPCQETRTTTVDAVKYRRSPVGTGPKRMCVGERQWKDARVDLLNLAAGVAPGTWADELAFIESVQALPLDERGSLLVAHIRHFEPPTVPQRTHWFTWVGQRMCQITAVVKRLERRYRYELDAVLDVRPSGWVRPEAPPDERKVATKVVAPLYGIWREGRLDVYDPTKKDESFVGAYTSWSHAVAALKRRVTIRQPGRIAVTMTVRVHQTEDGEELVVRPVLAERGSAVAYWSSVTRRGMLPEE